MKHILLTGCALLCLPLSASAYLNPEEVLLNRDLYLPPTARDAQGRNELQAEEAAARREREQEAAFSLQHPAAPEEEPEPVAEQTNPYGSMQFPGGYIAVPIQMQNGMFMGQPMFGSAPTETLDSTNLELLRTMRLLSRVNQNQVIMEHPQSLHGAAKPLAPSGAGAVLSMVTMAGSVLWTMRRAAKSKTAVIA